jgi:hypothetical protein
MVLWPSDGGEAAAEKELVGSGSQAQREGKSEGRRYGES